jgi:hypothetical protein
VLQSLHQRKNRGGFFWAVVVIAIAAAIIISSIDDDDDSTPTNTVTTTLNSPGPNSNISNGFDSVADFNPALTSQEFLDQLFANSENPMSKLYLPNYAYSQSLVYSESDVNVFGQVRILGGVVSKGRTQLGYGAMVTAVPEYVTHRTAPTQNRYHISEWKEL